LFIFFFINFTYIGNEDEDVAISAYQVSNTCMAMVRDKIVDACVEPSLMLVRETSNEQYIPDVFYKYKNKYDILVQEPAKPSFPTEYLLVTVIIIKLLLLLLFNFNSKININQYIIIYIILFYFIYLNNFIIFY